MSTAILSILSGIGGMFGLGKVSVVAVTMNLWAVFTMLFAFIFMGQRLSAIQSSGVLLIISGVSLASLSWSGIRNQRFQFFSGGKETISIVTITMAIIFLKDNVTKLQGLGMIIAIAGIIVTAL